MNQENAPAPDTPAPRAQRNPLRRHLRRLGMTGQAGIAVAVLAVCGASVMERGLSTSAADAVAEESQLRARLRRAESVVLPPSRSEQMREALDSFPPAEAHLEDLRNVFRMAAHAGLAIDRTDFRMLSGKDDQLVKLEVTFSTRQNFEPLRQLAIEVLNTIPHAALAGLQMQRGTIESPAVDARMVLNFFYRKTS